MINHRLLVASLLVEVFQLLRVVPSQLGLVAGKLLEAVVEAKALRPSRTEERQTHC